MEAQNHSLAMLQSSCSWFVYLLAARYNERTFGAQAVSGCFQETNPGPHQLENSFQLHGINRWFRKT